VGINDQILLRFAPEPEPEDAEARLREHIDSLLGRRFQPDRIVTYPLYPRRAGDGVDHEWCAAQYRLGLLDEKRTSPASRALGALRSALAAAVAREAA
jgi:hypothetical protein